MLSTQKLRSRGAKRVDSSKDLLPASKVKPCRRYVKGYQIFAVGSELFVNPEAVLGDRSVWSRGSSKGRTKEREAFAAKVSHGNT